MPDPVERLQMMVRDYQRMHKDLRAEVSALRTRAEEAEAKVAELEELLRDREKDLAFEYNQRVEAESETDRLRTRAEEAERERDEWKAKAEEEVKP